MATPLIGIDLGGAFTGTIYQDRLVLAGSAAISDLVLASQISSQEGGRTDFRLATTTNQKDGQTNEMGAGQPVINPNPKPASGTPGDADYVPPDDGVGQNDFMAQADDGFWFQQQSARQNTFHAILQQERMFIFGDLGEATIPPGPFVVTGDSPISIREASWYGTELGRPALIVGGLVVFIQKGGFDVRGINWSEQENKFVAPSLVTLSGNLFGAAVDMAFVPSQDRRADSVYIVGSSDHAHRDGQIGVMLVRNQQQSQNVAWSRWTTAGRVIGAASPLGNRAFLVERGGDAANGVPGAIGLEAIGTSGDDNLDAAIELPARFEGEGEDRVLAYAPLPDFGTPEDPGSSHWLSNATDLTGLRVWRIDKGNDTIVPYGRDEVLAKLAQSHPELVVPDERPVLGVFTATGQIAEFTGDVNEDGTFVLAPVTPLQGNAPYMPTGNPVGGGPVGNVLVVGMAYTRRVQTLPFAAQKQTGTSSRLRPGRIMEVNVDFILPAGYVPPVGDNVLREEILLRVQQAEVNVVAARRRRTRRKQLRPPKKGFYDTDRIVRVRYPGRSGYYDRVAMEISSERDVAIGGLAYRVVS